MKIWLVPYMFNLIPYELLTLFAGESPSSSVSDIDNLNNQALVDKTSLSKSNGTHDGSNIVASRNRPNFARLFDFVSLYLNYA